MPTFGGIVVSTGSEASGRRSLLDVIDELARPVNAADTTVRALAGDAFRAAVRTMNRRGLWPWEILDEELTITSGQAFSTASSIVKKPLAMHLLTATAGTRERRVNYQSYDRFLERDDWDVSGEPTVYTLPNLFETGQVRWYPKPSGTQYAQFTYYRVTPAPRTEAETIEVPDYALETYMAFAWAEFLKRLPSQQQPFPIAVAMQEARTAFRELSAHVANQSDRSRTAWGLV